MLNIQIQIRTDLNYSKRIRSRIRLKKYIYRFHPIKKKKTGPRCGLLLSVGPLLPPLDRCFYPLSSIYMLLQFSKTEKISVHLSGFFPRGDDSATAASLFVEPLRRRRSATRCAFPFPSLPAAQNWALQTLIQSKLVHPNPNIIEVSVIGFEWKPRSVSLICISVMRTNFDYFHSVLHM